MSAAGDLEHLLGEYYARSGREGAEAFIEAHPEHAEALRAHLELLDLVSDAFAVADAPARIGIYRLEAELGAGGMGIVYRAVSEKGGVAGPAGTRVALKLMHPHLFRSSGFFKRFLREAELGRRIEHSNVVRTFDVDAVEAEGSLRHFMVMEYVEGQTLRELLDRLGRVSEALAVQLGIEMCEALAAIHAAGAVHRDLKPENVLLTPDQTVKVMDLGVARLVDEQVRLSQTGAFVGSLPYAAPEQFRDVREVDHRADLHALGLVLYELSSGENPYAADDVHGAVHRILDQSPPRLGEVSAQVSPFFEELVHKLLDKDPDQRFASAVDLREVLEKGERSPWWVERARALRRETQRLPRRIRVARESSVFGRDRDLQALEQLFGQVKQGAGQVLLLEGEAGVGKTRLVDEFVARLEAAGEDHDFLLGTHPPGGAATATGALSAAYLGHVGDEALEVTLSTALAGMPSLVPGFAALLRGEIAPDGARPLGRESVQTAFVRVMRCLTTERPTILLIDDLHFAPEESLALFAALAAAVPDDAILLIGAFRPELAESWLSQVERLEHVQRRVLGRLGARDLVDLLKEVFGSEHLARDLGGLVAEKSDGNPLFAFEILAELRERGGLRKTPDGTWECTGRITAIRPPSSTEGLITARVESLSDGDRLLLDLAACCGYRFDPLLVAEVAGEGRLPALRRFARLEASRRLVNSEGRAYVFDHHLVQEVLYDVLPPLLRAEYHGLIAEALLARGTGDAAEPGALSGEAALDLVRHFLESAQAGRGLPYLEPAFSYLVGRLEHEAAADLARRALAIPGLLEGGRRAELLLRLQRPLDALDRYEEAIDVCREAFSLCEAEQSGETAGKAALGVAHGLQRQDRHPEATPWLDRARRIAVQQGDAQLRLKVEALVGRGHQAAERNDEALRVYRDCLATLDGREPSSLSAHLHLNAAQVYGRLGCVADRVAAARRSLEEANAIGNHDAIALASMILGGHGLAQGEMELAEKHFERAAAASRSLASPVLLGRALASLGELADARGDVAQATALFDEAWRHHRDVGYRWGAANARNSLGVLAVARGRLADAERHVASARVEFCEIYPQSVPITDVNLGLIAALEGRHEEAERALSAASDASGEGTSLQGYALERLGFTALQRDDLEAAYEHLQASCALREETRDLLDLPASLIRLGHAQHLLGERDAALASFDRAIDLAHRVHRPWFAALAHCHHAALGDAVGEAEASLEEHEVRLGWAERMEARHLLWTATHSRAHLDAAKALLDHLVEHTPQAHRTSMRVGVRLHREILEACAAQGDGKGT